jgi:hypothetical protein
MRIEFAILCYNSNNQESAQAAISYLQSCQNLVGSMHKNNLEFSCYHVINGNFEALQ